MEKLRSGLMKVISGSSEVKVDEDALTEEQMFLNYYDQFRSHSKSNSGLPYSVIPKFFQKISLTENSLATTLREDARTMFLQMKSEHLFENHELRALWILLDEHHTPPVVGEDQLINYKDYKKVRKKLGLKGDIYLTPTLFAKLQQNDSDHRVSIMAIFNYVMRKVWLHQTRIGLSLYDTLGHGYLKESDLENYILDLIPTLPQLKGLEKSFHSFYVCTAVRKFSFFLDPFKTGKIRVQDVLASGFLDDLLELRDKKLPKDAQEANWFSAPSALRVYGQYLNLDKNHNGMLSMDELARYGTSTLTPVFLQSVFQECLTYEGEMDYQTYLDFVLALENRHEPQALQYLFRILDINNKGYLDAFSLNYFYRAIQKEMPNGQEPASFQDVKDELFDMVKPKDPTKITLEDLVASGQGDTVVSILIDLNGFWTHENRESNIAVEDHADI